MNRDEYLMALSLLGLTPHSKETAEKFGLSIRQCQRYASGESEVPTQLVLLIDQYIKHGESK